MRIGLQIPDFNGAGGAEQLGRQLAAVARTADDAGFDSIGVMDHFFQISMIGPPEQDMLEAYTTLGYLAACTSRARLLTLVTGAVYRHPGILAKIVTTLDVLSGGRAWLGIGAAWNEEEARGLGMPFPPLAERFERLEEALRICLQMWAGRPVAVPRQALPAGTAAESSAGRHGAAPADHDRRLGRAEDAAAGGALRAGLQPVPRPGAGRASWTCCGRTARQRAATTTRSRRPASSGSTSASAASGRRRSSISWPGSPSWASTWPSAAVAGVWGLKPLEVMGSDVIPAVANL